jgi:hypothetical protein
MHHHRLLRAPGRASHLAGEVVRELDARGRLLVGDLEVRDLAEVGEGLAAIVASALGFGEFTADDVGLAGAGLQKREAVVGRGLGVTGNRLLLRQ